MLLHKAPLGLLGAFALKVLGRNPDKFGEIVTPQVDVYDQYLADQLGETRQQVTVAIGARTGVASHTPPNGFAWRVLAVGIQLTLDAADVAITGTVFSSITVPANNVSGVPIEPMGTMVVGGAVGTTRVLGHYFPRPLFLPPGQFLNQRFYLSANVTVAATANCTILRQLIEL